MSLIVLTSASGAPGVTTTALGLALGWSRPALLVEADPTGASAIAAGYLKGTVVPPEAMIELALAQRGGAVLDTLHQNIHQTLHESLLETLPQVSLALPGSSVKWVPGTRSHEQARTLMGLWEPLAAVLRSLDDTGQDVIVDAGRLGLYGSPEPLIYGADLTLLVTRTDLVSLAGARSWAETLKERFERTGGQASLAVLLVGEGQPFRVREVSRVLQVPVLATIAWDPAAAAVLSSGAEPPEASWRGRMAGRTDWEDSSLLRSYRATRSAITGRIRVNDEQLQTASTGVQR